MISNPEYLSKDRLKAELKSRGIKFNQNENKPYYVKLYRKKILEVDEGRTEFSSDEELTQRMTSTEKKKSPRKKKAIKMETYLPEVQELEDGELVEELERRGKDVGPITDSTRALYQRMLAKAMAENTTGKSSSSQSLRSTESSEGEAPGNQSFVGEWSEDDSELGETIVADHRRPLNKLSPVKPARSTGPRHRPAARRPPVETVEEEPDLPTPKPVKKRTVPKATSYQGFLILLLMFAVAFFSYEHYSSTEKDPSLITTATNKAVCIWNFVKAYIVKAKAGEESSSPDPPAKPPSPTEGEIPPTPVKKDSKNDKPKVVPKTEGSAEKEKEKAAPKKTKAQSGGSASKDDTKVKPKAKSPPTKQPPAESAAAPEEVNTPAEKPKAKAGGGQGKNKAKGTKSS